MRDSQALSGAPATSQRFPFSRAVLFTGHMIDAPGREVPRFPARAESAVRAAIRSSLSALSTVPPRTTVGVAGGACGGDILFHEVCAELGIPTRMLLALPPAAFIRESVAHGGRRWVRRFQALTEHTGSDNVSILSQGDGLLEGPAENIWQRANLWMIEEVLGLAPERILLALWDGRGGDGPGGTQNLIRSASAYGLTIAPVIAMQSLIE
jgi:hypothetical protein